MSPLPKLYIIHYLIDVLSFLSTQQLELLPCHLFHEVFYQN